MHTQNKEKKEHMMQDLTLKLGTEKVRPYLAEAEGEQNLD
jgi:hypothetical protein